MGIVCCAVFVIVGWGNATIPDEIFVADGVDYDVSDIFTVSIDENSTADTIAKKAGEYTLNVSLLKAIPVKTAKLTIAQRRYVVPGGTIIGLKLYTKGVTVVGIDDVLTETGTVRPAENAGIKCGDSITAINGMSVSTSSQVASIFRENDGTPLTVTVERAQETFEITLILAKCTSDGNYKAGLWIRDSAAGIGTMTFYDRNNGIYASLGHAVCDIDTGDVMTVSGGECVEANLTGCYKGSNGSAGELCGVFGTQSLGTLVLNGSTGAFGVLDVYDKNAPVLPVATASEITTGSAQIISTVDETGPQLYDIEITKLYRTDTNETRDMSIRVTDTDLIEKTGGIVQGMSGSPIIQNGMVVGAVTHVFINDPTQGYAIYAEKMMDTANIITQRNLQAAS